MYNELMDKSLATEQQGIELLYRGENIEDVPFISAEQYNEFAKELDLPSITDKADWSLDFNIPQHYKDLDVEEFVYAKLLQRTPEEVNRVEMELELYKARNLYPMLQLVIYIVDAFKKHNLVRGVGRGSSVASYVLYLLGAHKVDSHKYSLNIREFLK
jgi:DNA polymerase III alpha subunit|tara:strand:+ start:59 stop:532 length:474 start_codon:yes stop_codon:yes gene_type:complete